MTRNEAENLAIELGLREWDMGDEDGYGGEYIADPNAVEILINYARVDAAQPSTAEQMDVEKLARELAALPCVFGGRYTIAEFEKALRKHLSAGPEVKECTCPTSQWIGADPNDSTCELSEEEHLKAGAAQPSESGGTG